MHRQSPPRRTVRIFTTCALAISSTPKFYIVLIKLEGFSHGALYVECTDILPILLEQRNEKVDGQQNVGGELFFCHLHMPNCNSQTKNLERKGDRIGVCILVTIYTNVCYTYEQTHIWTIFYILNCTHTSTHSHSMDMSYTHLLHLEADGCLQFVNFLDNVIGVGEHCGELAGLTEAGAEEAGNLLDQTVRGEKGIVTLCWGERGREGGGGGGGGGEIRRERRESMSQPSRFKGLKHAKIEGFHHKMGGRMGFVPSFFTCFLSLLSFFRASTSMHGNPLALASSQCEASPKMHTFILGRGMCRNLSREGTGEERGAR